MTTVKPLLVELWNETYAGLALTPARIEELPIELGQLASSAETARPRQVFDTEPADFRALLAQCAESRRP